MNVELLRKIQAHNTAHPEQLDMGDWVSGCGAVACIAGHACLLSGIPASSLVLWKISPKEKGEEVLGLTPNNRLFYSDDWPFELRDLLMRAVPGTSEYAALVNARIDLFIETGGAE